VVYSGVEIENQWQPRKGSVLEKCFICEQEECGFCDGCEEPICCDEAIERNYNRYCESCDNARIAQAYEYIVLRYEELSERDISPEDSDGPPRYLSTYEILRHIKPYHWKGTVEGGAWDKLREEKLPLQKEVAKS
jgi:hypothetical protein